MDSYNKPIEHITNRPVHTVTISTITGTDHHIQTSVAVVTGMGGGVTTWTALFVYAI